MSAIIKINGKKDYSKLYSSIAVASKKMIEAGHAPSCVGSVPQRHNENGEWIPTEFNSGDITIHHTNGKIGEIKKHFGADFVVEEITA